MGILNSINDDHSNGYLAAALISFYSIIKKKKPINITMVCSGTHHSSTPVFLWLLRRRSRFQTYGEKTKTIRLHSKETLKEELR